MMPKIKAYKGGRGHIIPLDEAKVSTAYRCPWTNAVFATKKAYVSHLKELRQDHIHAKIRRDIFGKRKEDLWNQPTFKDIVDWVERNPDFFFDNAGGMRGRARQDRIAAYREKFWIRITYLDLTWSQNVSNTHDCPRDGVTNWGGREKFKDGTDRPRGYPGWHGRIEYQMSHDLGFGSDAMRGTGINTGTGGGISDNRYGYDVRFFESDWPKIAEAARNDRVLSVLSEERRWESRIKYGEPRYFR